MSTYYYTVKRSVCENVFLPTFISYLPVTVAALKPLGALAILGQPPAPGASADVSCKI